MTATIHCTLCGHSWTTQRPDYMASFNAHRCEPLKEDGTFQGSSWESAAIEAVKTLAAKHEPFTFADVTAIAGDPANPKVEAGKLMALAHRRGLVERQGYTQSKRETTKASAVAVWIGVAA